MACCALAAFVLSQIILAIDWARERAGRGADDVALAAANPAVAWRLGDAVAPSGSRGARSTSGRATWRPRPLTLALCVAVLTAGLGLALSQASTRPDVHVYHPSFWCSSALLSGGDGAPDRP